MRQSTNYQRMGDAHNAGVVSAQKTIQTIAEQHSRQSYAIKAGESTNHIVTRYEYRELNAKSRFNHSLPFLSPLSHSNACRTGLGLLIVYGTILILFLSLDGVGAWKRSLDEAHESYGAPPSLGQQNEDYDTAVRNTGLIFGLTSIALMMITWSVYYFSDRVKYMRGYRHFTEAMHTPSYANLPIKDYFQELSHHADYLLKMRFGLGIPPLAYMLTNLQETLLDPILNNVEDTVGNQVVPSPSSSLHHSLVTIDEEVVGPSRPSSPKATASSSHVQIEGDIELPQFQVPLPQPKTQKVRVAGDEASVRKDNTFRQQLEAVAKHQHADLQEMNKQAEELGHAVDARGMNIFIGKRCADAVQVLESTLNLTATDASLQQNELASIVDRLNRIEAALTEPSVRQGRRATDLVDMQAQIDNLKHQLLIEENIFILLLVFDIRKKMARLGTSIGQRAVFITTLLNENYYNQNPESLGAILYTFFSYCRSNEDVFRQERQADIQTFLRLSDKEKIYVLRSLGTYGPLGDRVAIQLFQAGELSKKSKAAITRIWVAQRNQQALAGGLQGLDDSLLGAEIFDVMAP